MINICKRRIIPSNTRPAGINNHIWCNIFVSLWFRSLAEKPSGWKLFFNTFSLKLESFPKKVKKSYFKKKFQFDAKEQYIHKAGNILYSCVYICILCIQSTKICYPSISNHCSFGFAARRYEIFYYHKIILYFDSANSRSVGFKTTKNKILFLIKIVIFFK